MKSERRSMWSRLSPHSAGCLALALVGACSVACADNATHLAYEIERAAATLDSQRTDGPVTAQYEPVKGGASPYTVMLFPSRPVTDAELVAAGVPEAMAQKLHSDLAYLGGTHDLLVVEQEGERLTFTSYWRRYAGVRDLVVSPRKTGRSEIVVRRDAGTNWVIAVR